MRLLIFFESQLENARRKKQALQSLFKSDQITRLTYERFMREIEEEIERFGKKIKILSSKIEERTIRITELIQILEQLSTRLHINFSLEEIDDKEFEKKVIFDLGIESFKKMRGLLEKEIGALKLHRRFINKTVEPKKGFNFYEGGGKFTGETASSLKDFKRKIKNVSSVSLEFHQKRGDFAKWMSDVLSEYSLANEIKKITEEGEDLRKKILELIKEDENMEDDK